MLMALSFSSASRLRLARALCGVSLALFVGVSGCNKSSGPQNSVSGKVTLNGEPVSGLVSFIGAGKTETAPSNPADGAYLIPNPPTGQVKITVKPMPGEEPGKKLVAPKDLSGADVSGSSAKKGVPPPAKYGSPATSGLATEIKPGKQTYDIPLTP